MSNNIRIERAEALKEKPDMNNLGFGKYFTDHMFILDYTEGKGWHDARIVPYGPLALDPSTMVLHYGQATFEGMKAYRTPDNKIELFRPYKNIERMNISNERLGIPALDVDFAVEAIKELVKLDESWVPNLEGTSLYIRPFVISTDPFLGVRPSFTYKFMVILSPVGAYYAEGINPVKIYVENEYVRAVKGGTGFAKTPGNYAASIKAQMIAHDKGYSQVLWLDGKTQEYIEEVGSMNVFFKINGEVVTPELNGSILEGITRNTVLNLLKHWGVPVSERKVSIKEVIEAGKNGTLEEAFGTGTAAVISPVGELKYNDDVVFINEGKIGEVSQRIYDTITGIQFGKIKDEFNWMVEV